MSAHTEARGDTAPLVELHSWGVPVHLGRERWGENLAALSLGASLTRGLGRSYGDASFPPKRGFAVSSVGADRLLAFDPQTGVLQAEAGVPLHVLNHIFLPRGFFSPVTPGTAFVSLGGMVAADVHGKNHHVAGTFGRFVRSLTLRLGDGRRVTASRSQHPDLFAACLGGMGLLGHILEVECELEQVPSAWLWGETERLPDLESLVGALKTAAREWPFTVAWLDCLTQGRSMGRGILFKGRWAGQHEAPTGFPRARPVVQVPFRMPSAAVHPLSVGAFNALYFARHGSKRRQGFFTPEQFFYPLDAVRNWNRLYGRRGMTQHQCVLPASRGEGAVRRLLERLTALKAASFLCVLKDCGDEGEGLLSFPMKGLSVAVDLAVTERTQAVVDALNEQVLAEGGRIYLAKDAFTRPEHFSQMEPRLPAFLDVKHRWDPGHTLQSALSQRLWENLSG